MSESCFDRFHYTARHSDDVTKNKFWKGLKKLCIGWFPIYTLPFRICKYTTEQRVGKNKNFNCLSYSRYHLPFRVISSRCCGFPLCGQITSSLRFLVIICVTTATKKVKVFSMSFPFTFLNSNRIPADWAKHTEITENSDSCSKDSSFSKFAFQHYSRKFYSHVNWEIRFLSLTLQIFSRRFEEKVPDYRSDFSFVRHFFLASNDHLLS